jgi:hypothetical protein
MPIPMKAPLPPDLDLDGGYTISFTAVDATTGAVVTGVVVSFAQMLVDNIGSGTDEELAVGPFMLVPGPGA